MQLGVEEIVNKRHCMKWLFSSSDNLKSKTCGERGRTIQNLKWAGLSVIAFLIVVWGAMADAQQSGKILRIGFLDDSTASSIAVRLETFRQLSWAAGLRSRKLLSQTA
jgi:hypothetical protein